MPFQPFLKALRRGAAVAALLAATQASAGSYEDFFIAITRDNPGTIAELLQRGFDPNSRDANGQTGLFLALRAESLRAADAIIQGPGLDVNARNSAGETALMMAALRGQTEQARQLLQRGANLNQTGWTPLHYAATGPRTELVAVMLDGGAAIDPPSPNGSTPLMMASRYGPEASVDLLLGRGADVNLRNEKGLSAADFAKLGGREQLAGRLAARMAK